MQTSFQKSLSMLFTYNNTISNTYIEVALVKVKILYMFKSCFQRRSRQLRGSSQFPFVTRYKFKLVIEREQNLLELVILVWKTGLDLFFPQTVEIPIENIKSKHCIRSETFSSQFRRPFKYFPQICFSFRIMYKKNKKGAERKEMSYKKS